MRIGQGTLVFAIVIGALCGIAHFVEWLPVFAARNSPVVDGRILARDPITRLGFVPSTDFTIRIEDSGTLVHARTQRYLMHQIPDNVRFHFSGDPTKEVFLFEEEESPLAILLACFLCSAFVAYILFRYRTSPRVRQLLSGVPIEALLPPTFHINAFGNYYAKLPVIAASLKGDTCPLLRTIVTKDLKGGAITETWGAGDTWWDFTYKGTKFTCMLLVASCEGSELYPASCTQSTAPERELLRELVHEITCHAIRRTA